MKKLVFLVVVGLLVAGIASAERIEPSKRITIISDDLTTNLYQKVLILPVGTRSVKMQAEEALPMRVAFIDKNVTGSGSNFMIKSGTVYEVNDIALKSKTPIYYNLSESGNNCVVQIEYKR